MSDGAWEYMMGVILHSNGSPCAGSDATYTSGFVGPYCNTTGSAAGYLFQIKNIMILSDTEKMMCIIIEGS